MLQVDMETHAGYMGGLNRTFCNGCTLPYYATSSEEILFHVSTRMPSKGKDIEQQVSGAIIILSLSLLPTLILLAVSVFNCHCVAN